MALVDADGKKDVSANDYYNDDIVYVKGTYDFSEDTGATTSTYDLVEIPVGCVIVDAMLHVETAGTSGGSATIIVGQTSDTDSIIESVAVAALTENSVHSLAAKRYTASGENNLLMTIGTAALTAGKFHLHVWFKKVD